MFDRSIKPNFYLDNAASTPETPFGIDHCNSNYLVDTAGVKRRTKLLTTIDRLSCAKTFSLINKVHVVLLVINVEVGLTANDLSIIRVAFKHGKSLVIAVNKIDMINIMKYRMES